MTNKYYLVYFFAKSICGDKQPDYIKIGRTTLDPSEPQTNLKRLKTLQTGNEAKIWELGIIAFDSVDNASEEEKRLHSQYGAFRAEGEWFIATPRILKYIKNKAMQHTDLFIEEDLPEKEDVPASSFGEKLKNARNGMTQEELAEKTGCSRGHIALIEQDRGKPGKGLYRNLVALFGPENLELTAPKKDKISLKVEMENGSLISENTGIDTFTKVIESIGIKQVKELNKKEAGIPLVADVKLEKAQKKVVIDKETYYIFSGTSNARKKKILDNIADCLNLNIKVFIN